MRIAQRRLLSTAVILALGAAANAASADGMTAEKAACVAAYQSGQERQKARELRAARSDFVACAAATCPGPMRTECTAWLAQADAAQPTIVVHARLPDGQSTADVHVIADHARIVERLDGSAIAVDPGEHELRFEHPPFAVVVKKVLLAEGEKLHAVEVDFAPLGPAPDAASPTPWPSIILGGVGAIAIGTFAGLGISGASRYDELKKTCAPNCSKDDTDALKTRFLAADIALGVGVAAIGLGAILYVTRARPSPRASSAAVLVLPVTGGGAARFTLRF